MQNISNRSRNRTGFDAYPERMFLWEEERRRRRDIVRREAVSSSPSTP
jgi:hypothetical protein